MGGYPSLRFNSVTELEVQKWLCHFQILSRDPHPRILSCWCEMEMSLNTVHAGLCQSPATASTLKELKQLSLVLVQEN